LHSYWRPLPDHSEPFVIFIQAYGSSFQLSTLKRKSNSLQALCCSYSSTLWIHAVKCTENLWGHWTADHYGTTQFISNMLPTWGYGICTACRRET
jgi:hypothetical protein